METELKEEGLSLKKVVNYTSEKITDLNEESKKIILRHPPDIIFVYSTRSAQSFIAITKNYSLHTLMTESKVMCISSKVLVEFKKAGWKNLEIFGPGEELLKIE